MSSEIQDDFITGSEQVPVEQTETADLLNFGDSVSEPSSTTPEIVEEGVEDLPTALPSKVDAQDGPTLQSTVESPVEEKTEVEPETVTASATDEKQEIISLKSPLGLFLLKQKVSPTVITVIYWQNVYKSAGIFGGALFLLLSMYFYTILSVVTNFGMAVLAVAFLYRIGMTIVNAVQKTSAEHPFKNLLEENFEIDEEMMDNFAKCTRSEINCTIKTLQRLFLVEDVFQSLKFGVLLWLISYIGSWFSPLTVIILSFILLFTVPKLYEEKQEQIDQVLVLVSEKVKTGVAQVEAKVPEKIMAYIKKNKKD